MALEIHYKKQNVRVLSLEDECHVQSAQERLNRLRGKQRARRQANAYFHGNLKEELAQKDRLLKEDKEIRRLKERIAALEQQRPVTLLVCRVKSLSVKERLGYLSSSATATVTATESMSSAQHASAAASTVTRHLFGEPGVPARKDTVEEFAEQLRSRLSRRRDLPHPKEV